MGAVGTYRARWAALLAVLAFALVSCSHHRSVLPPNPLSASSSLSQPPSPLGDGVLAGRLLGVGGPAPGTAEPWPGAITIIRIDGNRTTVPAGKDGTYRAQVPPGSYRLEGHSPNFSDNAGTCNAAKTVVVAAAKTTNDDVYCQMK